MIEHVLVLPIDRVRQRLLLAENTRGVSSGKLNGTGGKVEPGESPEHAAVRETYEELGITVAQSDLDLAAGLTFHFAARPEGTIHARVFLAERFEGEPRASAEKKEPHWFSFTEIPYDRMWQDDRLWLPRVLEGERLRGECWFDSTGQIVERHRIESLC